ncbi:late transcription factor [Hypsugopox virus]|nr:late transcription factor [Hypsugopox virus]
MSWSMNIDDSSNYKSLEEIRAHIKASAETVDEETHHDDLFPEDIEIPPTKAKTVTKRSQVVKKRTTTKPKTKATKTKDESDDDKSEDDVAVKSYSPKRESVKSYSSPKTVHSDVKEDDDVQYGGATVENEQDNDKMEACDLKMAADNVIKALKDINTRVSAIATVLSDVQAASCNKQYTALIKSIDGLKLAAEGGKSIVVRKKTKQSTKQTTKK